MQAPQQGPPHWPGAPTPRPESGPGPGPGPSGQWATAPGADQLSRQAKQDRYAHSANPARPEQFDSPAPASSRASRRSLIAGAGIAVAAGAAGFAWFATAGPQPAATPPAGGYSPPPDGNTGTAAALATVADIPEGGGLVLAGQGVVLTRESADDVRGFSSVCTHQGCAVSQVAGGAIICPCHGSTFSATTGAVITGPATAPLAEIPVTVTNGSVYPG